MSLTYAIQTERLTKLYGKHRGIEDVSLQVHQGEVFGFLGPNGAGKTTTIRIFLDLLRPTSGSASIFGLDTQQHSVAIKRRLGNIPGDIALYDSLKGREVLDLLGSFRGGGARRTGELAERFGLDLGRQVRAYSRGMKQKLAILQAFMHDPELYMLDEPTLGLDPLMQREFYTLLGEEHQRGKTIFFSSHVLSEAERLCHRVAIVREGRLVLVEEVEVLKRQKVRKLHLRLKADVPLEGLRLPGAELVRRENQDAEFLVKGEPGPLLKALAALPLEEVTFPEPTLEEAFLEFYQEAPGKAAA
ncbi:MAG: ATP-binding cassette domain-containing protein [Chloroflexi bacterium]|nr:ATP-binding cassette domain-containing protein [Chloroflexota bacterium]